MLNTATHSLLPFTAAYLLQSKKVQNKRAGGRGMKKRIKKILEGAMTTKNGYTGTMLVLLEVAVTAFPEYYSRY